MDFHFRHHFKVLYLPSPLVCPSWLHSKTLDAIPSCRPYKYWRPGNCANDRRIVSKVGVAISWKTFLHLGVSWVSPVVTTGNSVKCSYVVCHCQERCGTGYAGHKDFFTRCLLIVTSTGVIAVKFYWFLILRAWHTWMHDKISGKLHLLFWMSCLSYSARRPAFIRSAAFF